ncbi:hypothetical protein Patl1_11696 [Pistacia atlantica]|uniref:Uncharacterized protein n=1 Tax=Pistacia atlantica TaxID=434234 RepID=A0ACC1A245_9ROSI|nr:hypothetical protein Patl1_11696 [Pistacia atlantica]
MIQKHLPTNGIVCSNSLRCLGICKCNNLEYLFEDIGCLKGLRSLWIYECPRLISLPHGVRNLSSLEDLGLISCKRLNLDLSIRSDKQDNHDELNSTWPHLRFLFIEELPQLVEFPQWLSQCSTNSSERLYLQNCSSLKALPESMEKLQVLGIEKCPGLSALPKDMDRLIFFRELLIIGCPKLSERCKQETDSSSEVINTTTPDLYQTGRQSPGSLRYYGLGLENGVYNRTRQLKDFDMTKEATGARRAIRRGFDANVTDNHLEIHLFWAAKGTCCVPVTGSYGPLISALSVTPVLLGIGPKPKTFTYAELKSGTKDFDVSNKLGEGGFGTVYKIAI